MSWVAAVIGLAVRSVEVAQSAGFTGMFPVTFLSSAFCAPTRCRVGCGRSPTGTRSAPSFWRCVICGATRHPARRAAAGLPPSNPLLVALLWSVGILMIFVPLAINRYRSAAAR